MKNYIKKINVSKELFSSTHSQEALRMNFQIKFCNVLIHFIAGWFGSWLNALTRTFFFKIPMVEMNGKNTSGKSEQALLQSMVKSPKIWSQPGLQIFF